MSNGENRGKKLEESGKLGRNPVLKQGEKSSPQAKYDWLLMVQISLL